MEHPTEPVAIVSGGGGGIGLAIATKIVAAGGSVVLGDLNDARGRAAIELLAAPQRARFVHADVSYEPDVEVLVAAATESFGRLDAMFNNAGIGGAFGPITEQTVEAWDTTFVVNVRSVFLGIKHAARVMIEQGSGVAIVNTASVAGLSGGGGPQAYSATKAAVISLTQSAALNLIAHGINVNAIAPGVVDGEHWDGVDSFFAKYEGKAPGQKKAEVGAGVPYGRMGRPEDLTGMAVFLASADAEYIVSQCYNVDGGQWMS